MEGQYYKTRNYSYIYRDRWVDYNTPFDSQGMVSEDINNTSNTEAWIKEYDNTTTERMLEHLKKKFGISKYVVQLTTRNTLSQIIHHGTVSYFSLHTAYLILRGGLDTYIPRGVTYK